MNNASRTCGTITKELTFTSWDPRREKKRVWAWKVSEEIMTENIPILAKLPQRVIWENYKELYSHEFGNLDEMYQFLKSYYHSSPNMK